MNTSSKSRAIISSLNCKNIHSKHLVSFIVVNWNGGPYLEECIRSIEDQTFQDIEILLVDNNSSDGSAEAVSLCHPSVHTVFAKRNLGFAKGCNLGVSLSKGDIIAFVNNDAIIPTDWTSKMVCAIDCSGGKALTCPVFYYTQPTKYWYNTARFDALTGLSWHKGDVDPLELQDFDQLCGCAMVIEKSLFQKVEGFDEGYFVYGDDVDLSFKLLRLGVTLYFVRDTCCWHRVSTGKKISAGKVYGYKQKSDIRFCLKNLPFPYFLTASVFRSVLMPTFEASIFHAGPNVLVVNAKAALSNLLDMKSIFTTRYAESRNLGSLKLKIRFREAIQESIIRLRRGSLVW